MTNFKPATVEGAGLKSLQMVGFEDLAILTLPEGRGRKDRHSGAWGRVGWMGGEVVFERTRESLGIGSDDCLSCLGKVVMDR